MATTKKKVAPAVAAGYQTDKTLFATRYKQGGRTVYSSAMSPAQIAAMIKKPDPEVSNPGNRKIRLKHAQDFARYLMEFEAWVSPGVILRAPSIFAFEEQLEVPDVQFGVLSYAERNQGDIQILDGQHRILGFHLMLENVDLLLDKARGQKATARRNSDEIAEQVATQEIADLEKVRDRLYGDRVSVEIQVTDDLDAYRQMFYDIAENALGITASVKARFDKRKVVNRALEPVLEHPLLNGRVDIENDRIGRNNPNFLAAKHLVEIIRVVTVGFEGRVGRRDERELKDAAVATSAKEFFSLLMRSFPVLQSIERGTLLPEKARTTSLATSPLFLRILAGVHWELVKNHGWTRDAVEEFFTKLAPHTDNPVHANTIWKKYGPDEAFFDGATAPTGRRQDSVALLNTIVDWAIMEPTFLDATPEPAPEPEVDEDEDEGIDFAPSHDVSPVRAETEEEIEKIAKESKARGRARSTVKAK